MPPTPKPRFAVTGAAGFIGRQLVQSLVADNHEVTAIVRSEKPSSKAWGEQVRVVEADVENPGSLRGLFDDAEVVVHLAGRTLAKNRKQFDRVNVEGTRNVAESCARSDSPPRLVLVSSLAAGGPKKLTAGGPKELAPAGRKAASGGRKAASGGRKAALGGRKAAPGGRKATPGEPVSHYGSSKRLAEETLERFSGKLPMRILRPPTVFGENDPYMLGLYKTAKRGFVVLPGRHDFRYSLIHVDDLADAIIHLSNFEGAATKAIGIETIDVAQPDPMTFCEIGTIIANHFDRHGVRPFHIPSSVCWSIAGVNSLLAKLFPYRPLLNVDKIREGLAGNWICNTHLLTSELGFLFPHSLQQRIEQTADGYKRKGWL